MINIFYVNVGAVKTDREHQIKGERRTRHNIMSLLAVALILINMWSGGGGVFRHL